VALVSEELYRSRERGDISGPAVQAASKLRADFVYFSNYWYFDELANKDEEIEHFEMQCSAYRIGHMREEIENEIEKLNALLYEVNQMRSTEAVNRLAMLSMILGAGAVLTGYFGMNFGEAFSRLFFAPAGGAGLLHRVSIGIVSLFALCAILLGFYVIIANWGDYRDTFRLRRRT
jgi:Mg2+ and Co2+ transporter CorA